MYFFDLQKCNQITGKALTYVLVDLEVCKK